MVERIKLRFQKLRIVTVLAWLVIFFLGSMSRGVISPLAFWMLVIVFIILLSIDVVYFIIRVSEAHYLQVTQKSVVIKRVFQPPRAMLISDIKSILFIEKNGTAERIILSDGKHAIEIQHIYRVSKEIIIEKIKASPEYPNGLEIDLIKAIW